MDDTMKIIWNSFTGDEKLIYSIRMFTFGFAGVLSLLCWWEVFDSSTKKIEEALPSHHSRMLRLSKVWLAIGISWSAFYFLGGMMWERARAQTPLRLIYADTGWVIIYLSLISVYTLLRFSCYQRQVIKKVRSLTQEKV